jgi:hypothetical protein
VNASKRQVVSQCDAVAHPCSMFVLCILASFFVDLRSVAIECDLRPEQPSLLDCNDLTIALDGLCIHFLHRFRHGLMNSINSADPLLIPARTGMTITLATCTYVYVNLDTVEYSVCGSDIVSF